MLLANGTEANHTPEECVAARALVQMLGVCEAIVEEAARSMLKLRRGVVVGADPLTVRGRRRAAAGVGRRGLVGEVARATRWW